MNTTEFGCKRKAINSSSCSSSDSDITNHVSQPEHKVTKTNNSSKTYYNTRSQKGKSYPSNSTQDYLTAECPICLKSLKTQTLCVTDTCSHHTFCFSCLKEWSKLKNTCPVDRIKYSSILVLDSHGLVEEQVSINSVSAALDAAPSSSSEMTNCEVCGQSYNSETMQVCDGCGNGFHNYCLVHTTNGFHGADTWLCEDCWFFG